jgi:hypothetical protein
MLYERVCDLTYLKMTGNVFSTKTFHVHHFTNSFGLNSYMNIKDTLVRTQKKDMLRQAKPMKT